MQQRQCPFFTQLFSGDALSDDGYKLIFHQRRRDDPFALMPPSDEQPGCQSVSHRRIRFEHGVLVDHFAPVLHPRQVQVAGLLQLRLVAEGAVRLVDRAAPFNRLLGRFRLATLFPSTVSTC